MRYLFSGTQNVLVVWVLGDGSDALIFPKLGAE